MKRPLHEVLRWPDWVVGVYNRFLCKEFFVEERVERAIAELHADYFNGHRAEGVPPRSALDFMPDPWNDEQRELEQMILMEQRGELTL